MGILDKMNNRWVLGGGCLLGLLPGHRESNGVPSSFGSARPRGRSPVAPDPPPLHRYYSRSMCGLKVDQAVLGDLFAYYMPDFEDHMQKYVLARGDDDP